jgi:hypothetical protein
MAKLPAGEIERAPRFAQSSAAFCELWNNVLTGNDSSTDTDWYRFVLHCFERFAPLNGAACGWHVLNIGPLDTDGQKYAFLSDRVYSKCSTIKRGLKKVGISVDYPDGYLSRSGKAKSARPTYQELGLIFRSDATYDGPNA